MATKETATEAEVVRLSVNLNADTARALKKLANGKQLSLTEIIRRAISIYDFVDGELQEGNKVQTRNPNNGEVRELVMMA